MYNGALSNLRLTTDPFTMNRYAFAGGNPISNIELDGHYMVSPDGDRGRITSDGTIYANGEVVSDGSSGSSGSSGASHGITTNQRAALVSLVNNLESSYTGKDGLRYLKGHVYFKYYMHQYRVYGIKAVPQSVRSELFGDVHHDELTQAIIDTVITGGLGAEKSLLDAAKAGRSLIKEAPRLTRPVAGDNVGNMLRGPTSNPDFVVSPKGTSLPVPKGAVRGSVRTGKGFSYLNGSGGAGLENRVTGLRIMNPTGRYPNGYGVYMNKYGQTINPLTGKTTLGKADPWAHIPLK